MWDLCDIGCLHVLEGHSGAVNALSLSPKNSSRLASACRDGCFKVWDLDLFECTGTHKDDPRLHLNDLCFTAGGQNVITATRINMARIWRVSVVDPVVTLTDADDTRAVAVHPDQKHVITGTAHGSIDVWDVQTTAHVSSLEGHATAVHSLCVVPGPDSQLISGSSDGQIKVWSLVSGACIGTVADPTLSHPALQVCATADGAHIAAACGDGVVAVWRQRSNGGDYGGAAALLEGHSSTFPVYAVCCTRDGRFVISGSGDSTAKCVL